MLTAHHIVLDGWSMPILLQEIFAGLSGQRLPAAAPYRSLSPGSANVIAPVPHEAWREVLAGFETPTLMGPPERDGLGPRGVESFRLSEEITRALGDLARSHHTTASVVLQGGVGATAQLV